jgi:uroporphyrinogen-III synthase
MQKLWVCGWQQSFSAVVHIDRLALEPMQQVIVTRPEQDAEAWMGQLQLAGLSARAFPLLTLSNVMTPDAAVKAGKLISQSQAVMFVSANAVRFLAKAMANQPTWLEHFKFAGRAWCTGPGTAAALLACGIEAKQIDQPAANAPQLDSEALWQVVHSQVSAGMRVLFVRGTNEAGAIAGRDWLALQLESKKAQVQAIAAYSRAPARLSPTQLAQVHQFIEQGAVWLFSSSAAIQGLMAQCPDADWATAKVVVTHPRMAHLIENCGCKHISIASPGIRSLLASIKSLA